MRNIGHYCGCDAGNVVRNALSEPPDTAVGGHGPTRRKFRLAEAFYFCLKKIPE